VHLPIAVAFVLASFVAAWSDARTRRIPNALTISVIAFAVVAQAVVAGWAAAFVALALAAAVVLAGSLVHARGWLGGGDVKLIAGGAAAFGYPATLEFILYTLLAGGVFASILALRQQRLVGVLATIVTNGVTPSRPGPGGGLEHGTLPYSFAIAAAALVLTFLHNGLRFTL
jgi:prepilin peptidase CpaA